MMISPIRPQLIDRLPPVRGTLQPQAGLARHTWFRIGGPADVLFQPADEADLIRFMASLPADVPVMAIGTGSNLLVRDGGVEGVVVRLGKAVGAISVSDQVVTCGGGANDVAVSAAARDAGLAGLEFLRGIPGTIGGAVAMNAGAYGREMADILLDVRVVLRGGEVRTLEPADLDLGYRQAILPDDAIVISARLQGQPDEPAAIGARMDAINAAREDSQPLRTRTGGSTFRNPETARAWELVDAAGCRGLRIGGAQVSEKHCNFLINTGSATAADMEALGETVRRRVRETSGIDLHWEIRRIGRVAATLPEGEDT